MQHTPWFWLGVLALLLLPLSSPFAPTQAAADAAAQPADAPPVIRLQYATFDPLATLPPGGAPDLFTPLVARWQPRLFLVQFHAPVQNAWKTLVEQAGARLYGYVPDHALLARMDAAAAARIRQLAPVRWVGPYQPVYRVDPLFFARQPDPTVPLPVVIQTLPDANVQALAGQMQRWHMPVTDHATNAFAGYLAAEVRPAYLPHLAALDGVVWIEAAETLRVMNNVSSGEIMRADQVRQEFQLFGADQVVAVADEGLDTGITETLHPDIRGRLLHVTALGRPGDWSDPTGHGSHMVGSVLGNGLVSGSVPEEHQYSGSYAGVAPEAGLVFQSIGDAQGGLGGAPLDRGTLMREAYQQQARIHSNSWGGHTGGLGNPPEFGRYTISSRQVDAAAWEHPDMLILYAAGNQGRDANRDGVIDADGLTQPGTAKNPLTVGASESERPIVPRVYGNQYASPIDRDLIADNRDGMMAFSSRGPADDGRMKPDIVAPGTFVVSLRSRAYLFDDDMEGDVSAYTQTVQAGGTAPWQLRPDGGRDGSSGWQQVIAGEFAPGASTMLLTPPFSVTSSPEFDIRFWHGYSLGLNNRARVMLFSRDPDDPTRAYSTTLELPISGERPRYSQYRLENINIGTLRANNIDPGALQIGFVIVSQEPTTSTLNSSWWIDDVRVDAADWGTLGKYRIADEGDEQDEAYVMLGGTSSSTALTAGAATLVREWLMSWRNVDNPSAALIKALLINGAVDMSPGQYDGLQEVPARQPNSTSGWGRIDLARSLLPSSPRQVWFVDQTMGISTATTFTYTIAISRTDVPTDTTVLGGPLALTLVWTDYPGFEFAARALVNDLDMEVLAPDGSRYVGNQGTYSSGQCLRAGEWDACNNVEGIRLSSAPVGVYQVRVHGVEVAQGDQQPFALVVAGDTARLLETTAPVTQQSFYSYLPLVRKR